MYLQFEEGPERGSGSEIPDFHERFESGILVLCELLFIILCDRTWFSHCSAFSQTLGYLLAWKVVLRLVEAASDELRPKYSEFIENKVS